MKRCFLLTNVRALQVWGHVGQRQDTVAAVDTVIPPFCPSNLSSSSSFSSAPGNRTRYTSSFCFPPHFQVEVWMWEALCVSERVGNKDLLTPSCSRLSHAGEPNCLYHQHQSNLRLKIWTHRHTRWCVTKTHTHLFPERDVKTFWTSGVLGLGECEVMRRERPMGRD